MDLGRLKLLRDAAKRGKYAPLHDFLIQRFLLQPHQKEWKTSFQEMESILGFQLPKSARIHRPWWANNQGQGGGHSHALAWEMAGWRTAEVNLADESLVFRRE
jgi:hypothetical protein